MMASCYTLFWCLVFQMSIVVLVQSKISIPQWFNFTAFFNFSHYSVVTSHNLFCKQCCLDKTCPRRNHEFVEDKLKLIHCCVPTLTPFWRFNKYATWVYPLDIEYKAADGTSDIVITNATGAPYYRIQHRNGYLNQVPKNVCQFSSLVEVDFSQNEIETLPYLACLKSLDTLILSNNKIYSVKTSAFSNLKFLRHLDLSNNFINHIEPGALAYRPGSLLNINLSKNKLKVVDVTNVMLKYWFIYHNLSNNIIYEISNNQNTGGFENDAVVYGGIVNVSNNAFNRFPNLSMIGFHNLSTSLKMVFTYAIDMKNNNWTCDCHLLLYGFLQKLLQGIEYFPSVIPLYQVECCNPPELRNKFIIDFKNGDLSEDLLICNLTVREKCPPKCICFNQPSRNRTVVNCSNTELHTMPYKMPDFNNLEINFSHNYIKIFEYRDYLKRTTNLNLSFNHISVIRSSVYGIKELGLIDLRHNHFVNLDRDVASKNPCALLFGYLTIKCNCQLLWLKFWLEKQAAQNCNGNNITCITRYGYLNAFTMSAEDVCIPEDQSSHTIAAILLSILIVVLCSCIFFHKFQFEIMLFWTSLKSSDAKNKIYSLTKYDVYLSFEEENDDLRRWIINTLLFYLEKKNYTVFLPCRDLNVGEIQEEQIRLKVQESQSFIVFLTRNFPESNFQNIEWAQIWNTFKSDTTRKIIVVNYDMLETQCCINGHLRAFVRLGYALDFCNMDKKLLENIERKLGAPFIRLQTGLNNLKPRYNHVKTFDIFRKGC